MNFSILVYGGFVFLMWLFFRTLVKQKYVTTTMPWLLLLRKEE